MIHKYTPRSKRNTPEWKYFQRLSHMSSTLSKSGKSLRMFHGSVQLPDDDGTFRTHATTMSWKGYDKIDPSWSITDVLKWLHTGRTARGNRNSNSNSNNDNNRNTNARNNNNNNGVNAKRLKTNSRTRFSNLSRMVFNKKSTSFRNFSTETMEDLKSLMSCLDEIPARSEMVCISRWLTSSRISQQLNGNKPFHEDTFYYSDDDSDSDSDYKVQIRETVERGRAVARATREATDPEHSSH